MKIDTHEPELIERYVKQSLPESYRTRLNQDGYADYLWAAYDGLEQSERKQVGEILSDMDSVEDQLRRELQAYPDARLWLLIEGYIWPGFTNIGKKVAPGVWAYSGEAKITPRKNNSKSSQVVLNGARFYQTPYEKYEGFLTGLRRQGVLVRETRNILSTAKVLVQLEKSAQHKPTTLERYVKPRITFHADPQVQSLIGVVMKDERDRNAGIGPELGERLVGKLGAFASIWEMMNCNPDTLAQVEGVGLGRAKRILRSLGRTDI